MSMPTHGPIWISHCPHSTSAFVPLTVSPASRQWNTRDSLNERP